MCFELSALIRRDESRYGLLCYAVDGHHMLVQHWRLRCAAQWKPLHYILIHHGVCRSILVLHLGRGKRARRWCKLTCVVLN